jgi:hypothetical protein
MNPKDIVGANKPDMSLIPGSAMVALAVALGDGAKKYGAYNWRKDKVQVLAYTAACQRHIKAWEDGEENAKDSGIPHLYHAVAGLSILIDAIETGNAVDNRPPKGATARLLEKYTVNEIHKDNPQGGQVNDVGRTS